MHEIWIHYKSPLLGPIYFVSFTFVVAYAIIKAKLHDTILFWSEKLSNLECNCECNLKGQFPQTMWIGWVESNFTNPTVKVWADLDHPFKRSDYAKFCMSPSLDGSLPEYGISQEDNSPLTLYIDFHNFNFSWISIVLLIKFIHKCMHIHLSPNIPKYNRRGTIHFYEKKKKKKLCTVPLDSCTVVTSQILEECHLRGRHTQT